MIMANLQADPTDIKAFSFKLGTAEDNSGPALKTRMCQLLYNLKQYTPHHRGNYH